MRHVEKDVMLRMLDQHWREHLGAMDYLRQGIHLRGYAQKDYRFEYKREAFELFAAMLDRVKFETVSVLAKIEVRTQDEVDREEEERRLRLMRALQAQHVEAQSVSVCLTPLFKRHRRRRRSSLVQGRWSRSPARCRNRGPGERGTFVRSERKVGRNEPCPCGSGKKFKNCHGALSGIG